VRHPERVEDYLDHIGQAIRRAMEYVGRFDSPNAFQQRQLEQDAVIRNIEIIGEAASQIQKHAPEFVMAHPEIPWLDMRDMRNRMIHAYFDVNIIVVWNTVKDDLPRLKKQIEGLLRPEPDPSR
jgi:uncharacterized protein with HEPN domain